MHFLVAVILDKNTSEADIPDAVAEALNKFDMNAEFMPRIAQTRLDLSLKILTSLEEAEILYAKAMRIGEKAFVEQHSKRFLDGVSQAVYRSREMNHIELTKHELSNSNQYNSDLEGNLVESINPDGRWDWWVIGGRFTKRLLMTKESSVEAGWTHLDDEKYDSKYDGRGYFGVDACRIRHLELEPTSFYFIDKDREEMKRQFESSDSYAHKHYGGDFEKYVETEKYAFAHAIIDVDRNWIDSEDFANRFEANDALRAVIENADKDSWIVVVDCHS
jgi:hypothetical protein